jgi:hypothetical protein
VIFTQGMYEAKDWLKNLCDQFTEAAGKKPRRAKKFGEIIQNALSDVYELREQKAQAVLALKEAAEVLLRAGETKAYKNADRCVRKLWGPYEEKLRHEKKV